MGSVAEAEPVSSLPLDGRRKPTTFLDLPPETQKEIFNHCAQCDLICLSLVNRHFRELAAAQLYRNFHIVFPDEDDPSFDSPIDGLAGGLDTFVTGDYNYARHLRDLSLDTLSAGDKAEAAYKNYLYSSSCGKFMNTLLLLTLKKAVALESFRWNIRVELSRPVYNALHNIKSLKDLHIRMQHGESLYSTPPPLPYHYHPQIMIPGWVNSESPQPAVSAITSLSLPAVASALGTSALTGSSTAPGATTSYGPAGTITTTTTTTTTTMTQTSHQLFGSNPASTPVPKPSSKTPKKQASRDPPTLSGFKNLKTLAILDIDSLDIIEELTTCVQNSSSTLTKLKLSFSDALASTARKPPPDSDPNNDSDEDEEFQVQLPGNQHIPDDMTGPARAFRAAQMRKKQEAVLGSVFGLVDAKKATDEAKKLEDTKKSSGASKQAEEETETTSPGKSYIDSIKDVAEKLMFKLGKDDQEDLLDLIVKASKQYVESQQDKTAGETKESPQKNGASEHAESTWPLETVNGVDTPPSTSSVPEQPRKENHKDSTPDAINVEEPLAEHLSLDPGTDDKDVEADSTEASNVSGTILAQCDTPNNGSEATAVLSGNSSDDTRFFQDTQRPLRTVKKNIQEAREELKNAKDEKEVHDTMAEYVRSTRGIGLKSLSLHQIPIKAAVLTKALDFRTLERLTLLNVGNQAPLWAALTKLNRVEPLPLVKIFTDNVSPQFLHLVSGLREVHELFMLERSSKHEPENLAPRTTVKIADIRKHILKTHLPRMKRLMIKNESEPVHDNPHDPSRSVAWDVDEKTMLLICRKGKSLQELSISAGIRSIHTMVQHIGELTNLRALHIQKFRNEDTCVWVIRETRRFVRDNLTHCPNTKLEWLCIDDDRVDRILRHAPEAEKAKSGKNKDKSNAAASSGLTYPNLTTTNLTDEDDSDNDSTSGDRAIQDLKLELMESMQFYDIWGIRIFKKEVMAGRL